MMRKWLIHNAQLSSLLAATGAALLTGIYINILTDKARDNGSGGLGTLIVRIGYWHLFLLAAVGLIGAQYRLTRAADRRLQVRADELITATLEAAARSLVFPHNKHIRAIITLREGDRRVSRYWYNVAPDPERVASFPLEFGVTGEAYARRMALVRELQPDHLDSYPQSVKPLIYPDLKTVLAAPLLRSNDQKDEPLGALAFDSELPSRKLFFDRPEARKLAQQWADIVAQLLVAKEG